MQQKELRAVLRALGLRITRQDVITCSGGALGMIEDTIIRFPDGRSVSIADIPLGVPDAVEFVDCGISSVLKFNLSSGMSTEITPGRFDENGNGSPVPERAMPSSLSDLVDTMPELYPDLYDYVYYDELKERIMMDMTIFGRPDLGLVEQTDGSMVKYYDHMERRLKELGYTGRFPGMPLRDMALASIRFDNHRNLFREWVESHEWDGVPRLRTWFQDTFGATAPPLQDMGMEEKYLGDVAEAWFIGGIRRMYTKCKHEIVPVLISGQGIGKGLAIKYTAGNDEWYKETTADVRDPQKFLETTRGGVVVELSESKQIRSADHEDLKSFISRTTDQFRKPYGHFDEEFPRHFIFIATSNTDTMFTDVTGNRRFFPMYLDPKRAKRRFSESRSVGQYDVEQVWAEALYLYRNKHVWFLDRDCKRLAKIMQDYATTEYNGIDAINQWLDENKPEIGSKTCRKEILFNVFDINTNIVPKDVAAAFNAWAMSSDNAWVKHGSVRIPGFGNGGVQKGYVRVHAIGDRVEIETLKIVSDDGADDDDDFEGMPMDPESLIRHLAKIQGFRDTSDPVDLTDVDEDRIYAMLDEGFIYEGGYVDGKMTYRLGYLP